MQYTFDMTTKRELLENHMNLGGENSKGEKIGLNNLYFTKNSKPWIPVMGECHFSRLKAENWEEEILKMKAGGITVIATYMFWLYHEEIEGEWNFEGNNDINKFLSLCDKHNMKVVLRIGPWAHGEARNGGFPDWLLQKGIKLRDNNDEYIELVRKYYTAIYNQVKEYLFDNKGTVPFIQLENELVDRADHLLRLKQLAKEVGLNAPIYTVTGWNSIYGAEIPAYEVMPVFGGYPEAPWTGHTDVLSPSPNYFFIQIRNDSAIGTDLLSRADDDKDVKRMDYNLYPFATCELGGGICVTHHRRPEIKGDDVAALALVKLGCGNNLPGYYMYHGGTNQIGRLSTFNESKATGYPNDYPILSYDFQAPLGEYGLVRPQYREFKLQHMFLNDFMEYFAPMDSYVQINPVSDVHNTSELRYAMRMKDGSGFVFVNNYQRITKMGDKKDVQFKIPLENGTDLVIPNNPVTIEDGAYFIMPFNLTIGNKKLIYATAQLMCRIGDTYFFAEIKGMDTEYVFEDKQITVKAGMDSYFEHGDIKIVTLTEQQALMTYKFDNELYIGMGDMYCDGEKLTVYSIDNTDLSYYKYTEGKFEKYENIQDMVAESVNYTEVTDVDINSEHLEELYLGGAESCKYWKIDLSSIDKSKKTFIKIDYVGDVVQLYSDGKLVADEYYYGKPWIVDTSVLNGSNIILAVSALDKQKIYLETDKTKGCKVESISVSVEYKKDFKII